MTEPARSLNMVSSIYDAQIEPHDEADKLGMDACFNYNQASYGHYQVYTRLNPFNSLLV